MRRHAQVAEILDRSVHEAERDSNTTEYPQPLRVACIHLCMCAILSRNAHSIRFLRTHIETMLKGNTLVTKKPFVYHSADSNTILALTLARG